MTQDTFTIGITQNACVKERQINLKRAEEGVRAAAKRGAQIVCLQELFHATYFCTTQDQSLWDLAEAVDGPSVTQMQKLAKDLSIVIVVPFFERRSAGVYHNSAAVVDADGSILGVYRKMHIPDDPLYYEKYYFAPGEANSAESGFKVFDTKYAKIGVLICWDQWYPEAARITALKGAEVIFYPTAIGWHPAEKETFGADQVTAWQTIQRSHAIANGVYVASPNRVGFEETPGTQGLEFFGRSFISDPFGRFLAEDREGKAGVLVAECDRRLIESTRRNWPFLRDRRIDAYGGITARFLETKNG